MQNLSVQLTIPIPEDSVLITKVEYEQLKKENLKGRKFNKIIRHFIVFFSIIKF